MRKTTKYAVYLLFSIGFTTAHAQTQNSLTSMLVKHWEVSKTLTLQVADAMPDANYSFKATSAEMSFGGQMNHIAKGNVNYCSAALGNPKPEAGPEDDTKAGAKKALIEAFDLCINGLQKMSDADLLKVVGSGSRKSTAFELFWGGFTHTAHHRGQAEVYLRLKNVKPPEYEF